MDSRHLIRVAELLVHHVELVEEKLHNNPIISVETHADLFLTLEKVQKDLKELRNSASSINVFTQIQINTLLEGLEEKIITLYGRLDNRWIDSEILKIEESSKAIDALVSTSVKKEDVKNIQIQIETLKEFITSICENHRLLKKDRKTIAFAKNILKNAEAVITGKKHLDRFSTAACHPFSQKPSSFEEEDLSFEALELFEIADLFHEHKVKDAKSKYNQLREYPKTKVQSHLREDTNIVQALIAAAFEMADSPRDSLYMTKEQIDALFDEAHQVRTLELFEKDLSFKSKASLTG